MLQLSPAERDHYLDFIGYATHLAVYEDLLSLIRTQLAKLLPYEMAICGLGYLTQQNTVQAHRLLAIDFPVDYLKAITTPDGGFTSPLMTRWMQCRAPQIFDDSSNEGLDQPAAWLAILRRHGIHNIASHGVHDLQGRCTSYFAFCNLPERLGARHSYLLELLTPILHAALIKVADRIPPLGVEPVLHWNNFTPREIELLRWIAAGKQKKAIAFELGISENTVRNHLNNLYNKLGVNKATQAIERGKLLRLL